MSAVLETVDESWRQVPTLLRKLDEFPIGKLEAWSTALLHNCVAFLPGVQRSVAQLTGLDPELELPWRRGGKGEGDIAGCTEHSLIALAYIETKGAKTQVSYDYDCPFKCGEWQSQFVHMTHLNEPLLVVAPQRNLASREKTWHTHEGLPASAAVTSYSVLADMIEDALRTGNLPSCSLLEALYDVERVDLPGS
ncbi:hypothetical protein [Glaciibacter psychrotolerans]|uniref:Uncharacterized protein n=1 Tax=Glaciibacter psychrotolerans TaxID=670054 RepID=A0A7Z0EE35_9MICO|nr:hypothetical protein [Leifsonia psychrotolerans]NYJ19786.1 hypothetical protein [Leifsonia psychrotolerans]